LTVQKQRGWDFSPLCFSVTPIQIR
jgi:hypothetical protein